MNLLRITNDRRRSAEPSSHITLATSKCRAEFHFSCFASVAR